VRFNASDETIGNGTVYLNALPLIRKTLSFVYSFQHRGTVSLVFLSERDSSLQNTTVLFGVEIILDVNIQVSELSVFAGFGTLSVIGVRNQTLYMVRSEKDVCYVVGEVLLNQLLDIGMLHSTKLSDFICRFA
jgi:hypothetical protein